MSSASRLSPPLVLVFAASDPTSGAGIQADLMSLSSLGCHPLAVITAITVQDSVGVEAVLPLEANWVEAQARAVLEDMPVDAFKIGLLGSTEIIVSIARILADYPDVPLVLDPVLASGRGDELADEEMIAAMREFLLPRTTVLTPNSLEVRRLVTETESDNLPLAACAQHLIALGCRHVLLTGTHENTLQVSNTLYDARGAMRNDTWERLPGSYHGSGCTLASAVAAGLAQGHEISEAVREAQEYTWQTLAAGFRPGMGQFIPDRFFWARQAATS